MGLGGGAAAVGARAVRMDRLGTARRAVLSCSGVYAPPPEEDPPEEDAPPEEDPPEDDVPPEEEPPEDEDDPLPEEDAALLELPPVEDDEEEPSPPLLHATRPARANIPPPTTMRFII